MRREAELTDRALDGGLTMAWDFKSIVEYVKLKPRYLIGIGLTCLGVSALPQSWRVHLRYETIIANHAGWISLIGLASFLYGAVLALAEYAPVAKGWLVDWKAKRKRPLILLGLSREEKECLARYLADDSICQRFPLGYGVANSLAGRGIIYRASTVSMYHDAFDWNLQPWVVKVLESRPDIRDDILKHAPKGIRITGRFG